MSEFCESKGPVTSSCRLCKMGTPIVQYLQFSNNYLPPLKHRGIESGPCSDDTNSSGGAQMIQGKRAHGRLRDVKLIPAVKLGDRWLTSGA